MRRSSRFLSGGAVAIALGALVACGGGSSTTAPTPLRTGTPLPTSTATTRPTSTPAPTPTPAPTKTPTPVPTLTPTPVPTATPKLVCLDQALPGTYTTMVAFGNYNPSSQTFNGDVNSAFTSYAVTEFVAGSPSPTPVPTPTPTPQGIKVYLWSGVYTVTGPGPITDGCFAMVVTQDGQPLSPSNPDSGASIAYPKFARPVVIATTVPGRIKTLTIATSPTGGTGTFTLDDSASGTIVLHARREGTLDDIRRLVGASDTALKLPF